MKVSEENVYNFDRGHIELKVFKSIFFSAHPNTRAFITHGGLMGSLEALYHGVPMIGMPLFADQPRNVNVFVAKNMTLKLSLDDLTEEKMDCALKGILYDPKYRYI